MAASLDGPVSRYLNRRISHPVAALLRRTPVTPNEVSVAAAAVAVLAALLLAGGRNIEAGVLIQASSIVDGVDGDLARAKAMATRFGGVLDAALDRYADAAIVAGMAWYAYQHESWPQPALLGFVAIVGFLLISYSRARLETEGGLNVASDLLGVAGRDVRLLVLAAGAALGQCWWALAGMAALSYATVAWRLWRFRSGTAAPPRP
ncbi:MAG TPA: CDP-alcohol phosphatidyltransferase family protein [Dehalococcoidia bacterium]|nr:CDP-alcohol phosphatidyltransferase family protein [Dehalococcoidia bacterium]